MIQEFSVKSLALSSNLPALYSFCRDEESNEYGLLNVVLLWLLLALSAFSDKQNFSFSNNARRLYPDMIYTESGTVILDKLQNP